MSTCVCDYGPTGRREENEVSAPFLMSQYQGAMFSHNENVDGI